MLMIIYDISDQKTIKKLSTLCKDYGLYRIQKSVFIGELNFKYEEELLNNLKNIKISDTNSICIIPLNVSSINNVISFGYEIDKELFLNKRECILI